MSTTEESKPTHVMLQSRIHPNRLAELSDHADATLGAVKEITNSNPLEALFVMLRMSSRLLKAASLSNDDIEELSKLAQHYSPEDVAMYEPGDPAVAERLAVGGVLDLTDATSRPGAFTATEVPDVSALLDVPPELLPSAQKVIAQADSIIGAASLATPPTAPEVLAMVLAVALERLLQKHPSEKMTAALFAAKAVIKTAPPFGT